MQKEVFHKRLLINKRFFSLNLIEIRKNIRLIPQIKNNVQIDYSPYGCSAVA